MTSADTASSLRIGEVGRRTGISPALLRAWELRYGLLDPERSPGGTRLYSADDLRRIELMQSYMADGLAPAEAARAARAGTAEVGLADELGTGDSGAGEDSELETARARFRDAMIDLDRELAEAELDALLASLALPTLLRYVVLPYLEDVGRRWEAGEDVIAEEHLASNVLRARLSALTRSAGAPARGTILMACPAEERHDLPLVMMGVLLRGRGWRTVSLGADTPVASIADAAQRIAASGIVLAATRTERFVDQADDLRALAARWPLMIAGAGATPQVAGSVHSHLLGDLLGSVASLEEFLGTGV